ncbi:acid-sensing ion channel 3 [Plakobranchus ocellatus]|uniref:Acid-sensing ion channel 3 n=1 Tax=Plakobranchus ocellatus TaxID=259542 RepID=A0AAV3ZHX4_9GAST|nr:acid-sensing ion channel 3 [Plakobranchus ocellatus]
MVRLNIYDYMSTNIDTKDNSAYDFYIDTTSAFSGHLDDLGDINSAREASCEEVKDSTALELGAENLEKNETSQESLQNLSQIWWRFLGETTLHGCKNVKERWVVKRIMWSCAILLMAAFLGWSLLQLFLRYQEHPFVSVFSFQRENTILAPGLSMCLPARFNKQKVSSSRPAYQMFAYDSTGITVLDREERQERSSKEFLEQMKSWEKDLENITLHRARGEIGFTRKEIFFYARLFTNNKEYDIVSMMENFDLETKTCWLVKWSLSDAEPGTDADESSDPNETVEVAGEIGDISHYSSSIKSTQSVADAAAANNTEKLTTLIKETLSTTSSPFLSSTSKILFRQNQTHPTTNVAENLRISDEKVEVPKTSGGDDTGASINAVSSSDTTDLLRLGLEDAILLMVDLQQHNWLGHAHVAGLELYLHDPIGGYWSVKPIHLLPGTYTSIYYTTTQYKFLPLPYKSFSGVSEPGVTAQNTGCVDTTATSFRNPMVSVPKAFYSSDTCILEHAFNLSTKQCGCGVSDLYNKLHGTKNCSVIQHKNCFLKILDDAYTRQQRQLAIAPDPLCPQACSYTTFAYIMSNSDFPPVSRREEYAQLLNVEEVQLEKNILVVEISPQGPMADKVEHVPELTVLSILGSVGGLMGLCLGASLLTLTEFFEALALSTWVLYRRLICRERMQT